MFVPHQEGENVLANYKSGNTTTKLHFEYIIPLPNNHVALHPIIFFDVAGIASLFNHLNGAKIVDYSQNPNVITNTLFPKTEYSFLKSRRIQINFVIPEVIRIKAVNPDGVYTAGDIITIQVQFTQPVMIIYPPVLRMNSGSIQRNAMYSTGNMTDSLYFEYYVEAGDYSRGNLDYVDTRDAPYYQTNFDISLALNTDIHVGSTGRLHATNSPRYNDIFLYATEYGGIFRSSLGFSNNRVAAKTSLPLPGTPGSLSATSMIIIDTRATNITGVFTPVTSGAYGSGFIIPILVGFNFPVVVGGCPKILFQSNNVDYYATYVGGSGTRILEFQFTVSDTATRIEFDYRDRHSLVLAGCNSSQVDAQSFNIDVVYIRRNSMNPTIDVNLTLPWVKYVESVIAPRSLTGIIILILIL